MLLNKPGKGRRWLARRYPANADTGNGCEPQARKAHDYGEPEQVLLGQALGNNAEHFP